MKSKIEETKQFMDFLNSVEKGGYLDMMFGRMRHYVEEQIKNDFGVCIQSIITSANMADAEVQSLKSRLKEQVEMKEDFYKDYNKTLEKLQELRKDLDHAQNSQISAEKEAERAHMRAQDAIDKVHNFQTLKDEVGMLTIRMKEQKETIIKLKARLYDKNEETNG